MRQIIFLIACCAALLLFLSGLQRRSSPSSKSRIRARKASISHLQRRDPLAVVLDLNSWTFARGTHAHAKTSIKNRDPRLFLRCVFCRRPAR